MEPEEIIRSRFDESAQTLRATLDHLAGRIEQTARLIVESYRAGGGVLLFGNGGSAADAQHVAGELVGRFLVNRRPLRAVALPADGSVLTCLANDFGYEAAFARQLEAGGRPGDVAWAMTTSGNSPSVVAGLAKARELGLRTIALTGRGGGKCAPHADVLLDVPSSDTPRVQEAHAVVYHVVCELVEAELASK